MPIRFKQVDSNLYRGGAPSIDEIDVLKNIFGIAKIISLDGISGASITNSCNDSGIQQEMMPISFISDNDFAPIVDGVSKHVDSPTFVHCFHGKDRTGLFVAKYRIENGIPCDEAIAEALEFGFGTGLDKAALKKFYTILVNSCKCEHKHVDFKDMLKNIDNISDMCEDCGMVKNDKICNNCEAVIATASAAINFTDTNAVEESKVDIMAPILDDEELPGGNEVSDMLSGREMTFVKSNKHSEFLRTSILKYLYNKTAGQKMSFPISSEKKKEAKECCDLINDIINTDLKEYLDYIDKMYIPFKENLGITEEQANSAQIYFDIFIKNIQKDTVNIKEQVMLVLKTLEYFEKDINVFNMMKSLKEMVANISGQQDELINVLQNEEKADTFQTTVIGFIEDIKKMVKQLENLLFDRIVSFIKKDIINEDWTSEMKKDIVEDKIDVAIEENEQKEEQKEDDNE